MRWSSTALADRMRRRVDDGLHRLDEWAAGTGDVGPIDPRTLPWTIRVRDSLPTIQQELDDFYASGAVLPRTAEVAGFEQGEDGDWTTLVLSWFDRSVPALTARFGGTMAALADVPNLQAAGFTILGPRSSVPMHQGPTHSIRYLLGVSVPADNERCTMTVGTAVVRWVPGAEVLFDDRTPHGTSNDTDERRALLFVQVRPELGGTRGAVHRATQWVHGRRTAAIVDRASELAGPVATS